MVFFGIDPFKIALYGHLSILYLCQASKKPIVILKLEFAKAFDTVEHEAWRGNDPSGPHIGLPGSWQGRSPLERYMKPGRPSTSTWSRRQKLLVNPN
jgi:hypothetical protein